MIKPPNKTTSNTLMMVRDMKCTAASKISTWFAVIGKINRLMPRWTMRNTARNNPANAIMNFFVREE